MSYIQTKRGGENFSLQTNNAGGTTWTEPNVSGNDRIQVSVNVDNSTIEISSNTVQLKDGGISTAKLANSSVTFAKIQNLTAARLLGNPTGGAAAPSEISLSAGHLAFSGSALGLPNVGPGVASYGSSTTVPVFTLDAQGRVTAVTNTTIAVGGIADGSITWAKLQDMDGLSVLGRSANTAGVSDEITAATDGHILRRSGTTLGFGQIVTAGITDANITTVKIADANVTFAKMVNSAAGLSVVGRSANTAGVFAEIVAATDGQVLQRAGTSLAFGTIATAGITNAAVTYAKIQNGTALSVLGVTGNAAATLADIVAGTDGHVLRRSGTSLTFGQVATAGIANAAITTALIADSNVTTAKIADANVTTIKIADANVTLAKIVNGTGLSVIGRSANTAGVNADIVAATDGHVLRLNGTTLGFGTIATGGIADAAITYAKLQNGTGLSVVGRAANSAGVNADIVAATDGQVFVRSGTSLAFSTVATAGITNSAVTFAKIQNIAGKSILGKAGSGSGVVTELTASVSNTVLTYDYGSTGTLAYTKVLAAMMENNTITGQQLNVLMSADSKRYFATLKRDSSDTTLAYELDTTQTGSPLPVDDVYGLLYDQYGTETGFITATADADLTANSPVRLYYSTGVLRCGNATAAAASSAAVGFIREACSSSEVVRIYKEGKILRTNISLDGNTAATAFTFDGNVFLTNATPAAAGKPLFVTVPPTASGTIIQRLGFVRNGDNYVYIRLEDYPTING